MRQKQQEGCTDGHCTSCCNDTVYVEQIYIMMQVALNDIPAGICE